MLKLVIFDLDGTIAEYKLRYDEAREEVLKYLEERGIDRWRVHARTISQILAKAEKIIKVKGGLKLFKEVKREAYRRVEWLEMEAARSTSLIPGVKECFKKLKEMGLKIAIATNNNRRATEYVLKRLGVADYVDYTVTRNDVEEFKPNPTQLKWLLSKANVSREEAIYVGDSFIDIIAAKKAGIKIIAVPFGLYSIDELKKHNPDYLAKDYREVLEIIGLESGVNVSTDIRFKKD